jgi:hypothetical protein
MVHDARASSSDDDSDTDSSGSDDSDDASESDYPPNMSRSKSTHNPGSDAVHQAHQHLQRFHHEAGQARSSLASSQFQGPHLPPDGVQPISVSAEEQMPIGAPMSKSRSDAGTETKMNREELQERGGGANCCSTM